MNNELMNFARFVVKEVLDDNFKDNADSFAELACRKLVKLGLVELDGDTYKEVKIDLCETCKKGDDCIDSTKIFSNCSTSICYKYEEGASKIEFKNICIYPTDNENIYVIPTEREADNES